MINFKRIFGVVFILILLTSCGDRQTNNDTSAQQETPKALQDNKISMDSYRGSSIDLVESLYQELVEKNPALQKLEEELEAFRSKTGDLDEKYSKYNSKSSSYYSSAKQKLAGISDSLLRMKVDALLTNSSKKYATKTAEINALLAQISKNGSIIHDYHVALKIILTLPIIEKYQDNHQPNQKVFEDLVKKQNDFILQTDTLTPKN